ncbi:MAG: MFS transporter [Halobacteriales archaeon]|nr:MFS transporter [Halobacteriales archaeon]
MPRLPVGRAIALLGLVSLLTDIAGEMAQPLLPLFLSGLGVGALGIGAVEGAAEAAVSLVKVASGRIADRVPRRKPLVVLGYGIAALAKPALGLAQGLTDTLLLRSFDRVGKGVRGAPRDAMIADLAAEGQRGLAFGFHRMADTLGAVAGPLISLALLAVLGQGTGALRTVFLLTALPMLLALAVLVLGVREPAVHRARGGQAASPLPGRFHGFLAIAALFGLGQLSYVFFLLRAAQLGASTVEVIALYLVYNAVYAAASIPAGKLSDKRGRAPVLAASFALFGLLALGFALAPGWLWTLPLFALYGVFSAGFETVSRAFAVDLAPREARARGLGMYHATVGMAALPAGIIGGLLWERVGPWASFAWGAGLALLAALLLLGFARAPHRPRNSL